MAQAGIVIFTDDEYLLHSGILLFYRRHECLCINGITYNDDDHHNYYHQPLEVIYPMGYV